MANRNEVEIEVKEDGGLKITIAGRVDQAIHVKAEEALKAVQNALGGNVTITNLPHSHESIGVHIHGGIGHQH